MMRSKLAIALVALFAACVGWMALTPAASASTALSAEQAAMLQQEVDSLMQRVPGGTQVSRNEIAWHGGRVTATVPVPGTATAAGSFCNARSICLYAHANQRPTKMTYRCGWWDVTPWFPPGTLAGVSSWHATTTGGLSNIAVGSPPGTPGSGIPVTRGLGNVPGWFNDHAKSVSVCN